MTTMKRRTFIQSAAAALFAPTALLQRKPDKPLDAESIMAHFCDDDVCRWDLASPFPVGSMVYATDARIAIRCELSNVKHDGDDKRRPPVEQLWRQFWWSSRWEPLILPPPEQITHYVEGGPCPHCDNRRIYHGATYPSECRMNLLLDYDVDTNTSRDPSCPACRGKDFRGPNVLMVCGEPFYYSMLKKLALVPDVMVCANRCESPAEDKSAPMLFRGGPFEGMAMGLYSHNVVKVR